MLGAYYERAMESQAVFEFYVRRLPENRNFLLMAGLEQLLDYLATLRFSNDDLAWLESTGRFKPGMLARLADFRFSGDVYSISEGSVFFADEPVLRVMAPLPEAQFIESRLINLLHFQTLIASKAARCRLAAGRKRLVDYGMRRAHGAEAALLASRASYLGGFDATATLEAARRFGIPIAGSMSHAFVQAHATELEAFRSFAQCHPNDLTLLIDTFDVERGAARAVELARELQAANVRIRAVRIDSGDLAANARRVRSILDKADLADVEIVVSGALEEYAISALARWEAPIDCFGVGTKLDVSADSPMMDCVYKLQEYAGRASRKKSVGKGSWPGRRQVHRTYDDNGRIALDMVCRAEEVMEGRALLHPVMLNGHRTQRSPPLAEIRAHAMAEIATLPLSMQSLDHGPRSPVKISPALRSLASQVDRIAH